MISVASITFFIGFFVTALILDKVFDQNVSLSNILIRSLVCTAFYTLFRYWLS